MWVRGNNFAHVVQDLSAASPRADVDSVRRLTQSVDDEPNCKEVENAGYLTPDIKELAAAPEKVNSGARSKLRYVAKPLPPATFR